MRVRVHTTSRARSRSDCHETTWIALRTCIHSIYSTAITLVIPMGLGGPQRIGQGLDKEGAGVAKKRARGVAMGGSRAEPVCVRTF